MPAPDVILETTRALANDWRSLAFGWHLLFGLVALFALAGWRPRPVQLAALVLLPFVSVMTLAWTARHTFTAFAFLLATIGLIAAAASLGEHPAAPGSRVEVFAGAVLIGLGWCYPHFLDGVSWTRYLYEAPLGVVPCATLSFAAGVSLVAGGLGSRAWSWLLAAMAAYYGVVGVFVLGVVIDAALVAGAIMLAVNASRRRIRASVSRDAIAASVAVTILASATAPASAQAVPDSDAVKTFVEATAGYARMHRRLERETGQIQINSTAESIATAVDALAQAIRSERATARHGDFFRPDLARELRIRIDDALADRGLTASDVRLDQVVDGIEAAALGLRVNATFSWVLASAPMTPCVIAVLPPLPPELQYRFVADDLVLIDVHASLIVDVMPNALAGVTTRDL